MRVAHPIHLISSRVTKTGVKILKTMWGSAGLTAFGTPPQEEIHLPSGPTTKVVRLALGADPSDLVDDLARSPPGAREDKSCSRG